MLKPVLNAAANWVYQLPQSQNPKVAETINKIWQRLSQETQQGDPEIHAKAFHLSEALRDLAKLIHSNSLATGNIAQNPAENERARLTVGHKNLRPAIYNFRNMPDLLYRGIGLNSKNFDRALAKVSKVGDDIYQLSFYAQDAGEVESKFDSRLLDQSPQERKGENYLSILLKNENPAGNPLEDLNKISLRFAKRLKHWTPINKFQGRDEDLFRKLLEIAKDAELLALCCP